MEVVRAGNTLVMCANSLTLVHDFPTQVSLVEFDNLIDRR